MYCLGCMHGYDIAIYDTDNIIIHAKEVINRPKGREVVMACSDTKHVTITLLLLTLLLPICRCQIVDESASPKPNSQTRTRYQGNGYVASKL